VKRRLDEAVAERAGISRARARTLIVAGRVRVEGKPATKPGHDVAAEASIEVERAAPYVSRGGEKLEAALAAFRFDPSGLRALDIGASTGGFTDCLLKHGAAHVVAVDVGYGQLAWQLRTDPRVSVVERCNVRTAAPNAFGEPFDCIVIDASFISVRLLLERAAAMLSDHGAIIALVKPQFEAGRESVGRGGVVRDPAIHRRVLVDVRDALAPMGLSAVGVCASPLLGPAGNREFFLFIARSGPVVSDETIAHAVENVQP